MKRRSVRKTLSDWAGNADSYKLRRRDMTDNKTEEKIIAPPDLAEALTTLYEETTA